jgi:hypothetical protein
MEKTKARILCVQNALDEIESSVQKIREQLIKTSYQVKSAQHKQAKLDAFLMKWQYQLENSNHQIDSINDDMKQKISA